ncbi:AVAST type 3 anti-phage nuclease/ATPase Avs3a [Salinisphaera hydrothermalis]|uniref:AVAST type 3 anti-phage nuclease/ATPase Avs3a n=1 Tax=Salinisphaera hydrothermalis TaxID=563188 RepID=UPI003340B5E6
MTNTSLVRASRDGDQFHYLWAARRCLSLLDPRSGLVAIAIEGASKSEVVDKKHLEAGEELIDVAEYYGSEDISQADRVTYIQLKHSTYRISSAWTVSGIAQTVSGFFDRYRGLRAYMEEADVQSKIAFWFVSNRPIQPQLLECIMDAANGDTPRHAKILKRLKDITSHDDQEFKDFCSLLTLEGNEDGYWEQRNILFQDVTGYLSDLDVDAPVQLKELVNTKALSENTETPTITKFDVLRALKVDENDLFPASCLIRHEPAAVARRQEPEFTSAIIDASERPVLVHAAGGVGKSVFATRIGLGLPEGSCCILYDCFGNGQYRNASEFRHRHKDAIPQIANELARQGLCHPLIRTTNADSSAYIRSLIHRLRQSAETLTANYPNALLCIVVDAADNAQMAAEEMGESRSFVLDLLRETMPKSVRLVALCRSHRLEKLDPPLNALSLELLPFNRAETVEFLRRSYPYATEQDADEFHTLSSQNPRVQSVAIAWGGSLADILHKLGPEPTTVEDTIVDLFDQAIAKLRDSTGRVESDQIDKICKGLAALRPLIPIPVLALMSGVPETAIRSFAFDLGRPLVVTESTIQFFDEPSETWFRERFKPSQANFSAFVEDLRSLSRDSPYIASVLPQLMLEAEQYTELVALALSSEGLPENSPIERRDVELQRLQFALKACLRSKRYLDAAKLAVKAAGETAGDDRQQTLLQEHTDLAAVFLDPNGVQEVVSRRTFGSGWAGSHHAYEAGLMSGKPDLLGSARSRLRMADQWLRNWSRLPKEDRQAEEVSVEDIAVMAMADLNIHGAGSAASSIRRWRPRSLSFEAGTALARQLVDHGRYEDLAELSRVAGNNIYLVLAIARELRIVHRRPPRDVVEPALRLMLDRRIKLRSSRSWGIEENLLDAVVALVEAAHFWQIDDTELLAPAIRKELPQEPRRGLASPHGNARFVLVQAYTLHAALADKQIELADLAHPELKDQLEAGQHSHYSQEVSEFKENIGAILPWHRLRAQVALGRVSSDDLLETIQRTRAEAEKARSHSYRDQAHTSNEIALIWLDILIAGEVATTDVVRELDLWRQSLDKPLFTTTLTKIARLKARTPGLEEQGLVEANRAFQLILEERDHADAKAEAYIQLARAVLTVSPDEAEGYFDVAVEVASRIGDEVIDRWGATLDLADRAETCGIRQPEMAYRLARGGELIYDYMARDKHFDWHATVTAIAGLCPSSVITILSRWRDRDFGWSARVLPIAIHSLCERGHLSPKTALGLLPLRAEWELSSLLDAALKSPTTPSEKKTILDFFWKYTSLEDRSSKTWRSIKRVFESHQLQLRDIDAFIRLAEHREQSRHSSDNYDAPGFLEKNRNESSCDWDAVFDELDLTDSNDIALSYDRSWSNGPPFFNHAFFSLLCQRAPIGKEAKLIEAVAGVTRFDLFDYRRFLEQIPNSWKSRVSTRRALTRLVKSLFGRFCIDVTNSRYYQKIPFELACNVSELEESELVEITLSALGETTQALGASRLFTLVSLLASKLSDTEAREALSFTLGLLEESMLESDGDGQWSKSLAPPDDVEEAVAGYLWTALAAPEASYRWEAAHSVRGSGVLGRAELLNHLMRMFSEGGGGPFVDARLHFYELHARQWLLIAFARMSMESPVVITPHAEHLSEIALGGTEHVLLRRFAARSMLELMDRGYVREDVQEREKLEQVNQSLLPKIQSESFNRVVQRPAGWSDTREDDRFYFGIDIGPHWFEPLGRCFGVSQAEIERRARDVIRDELGLAGTAHWNNDQRARRGVFRDRATRHSHGSYPRTDDLRFYLSYHAMMVVAGRLLARLPLHEDSEYSYNDFYDWLDRHALSRADGGWLADRRDTATFEWPEWKNEKSVEDWRWSLDSHEFDELLFGSDDGCTVWGHWNLISYQRVQTVNVASALVSTDRSQALLRALQTAIDPHAYRIPPAGNELEIDQGEFQLKGWVVDQTSDAGIDEKDPWAGDIRLPPPRPAKFVKDLMSLSSDSEQRVWHAEIEGQTEPALQSRLWGHFQNRDDEDESESGQRLVASMPFIRRLLHTAEADLLLEVQIDRRPQYSRYPNSENDGLSYIPSYTKLFLIRHDGDIFTI